MTYAQYNRTRRQHWVDFVTSLGGTPTNSDTLYQLMRKAYIAAGGTIGCCETLSRYRLVRGIYNSLCTPAVVATTYYNTEQSYTAECDPGQLGDPVTVTIAAGQYSSTESQAAADAAALAAATAQATGSLVCTDNNCSDWTAYGGFTLDPALIAWVNAEIAFFGKPAVSDDSFPSLLPIPGPPPISGQTTITWVPPNYTQGGAIFFYNCGAGYRRLLNVYYPNLRGSPLPKGITLAYELNGLPDDPRGTLTIIPGSSEWPITAAGSPPGTVTIS